MQCMEYSKIWLNLIFAALNLTFIRGQKAFPVFNADRVIIRLPCGQGQLSRIWEVQCGWLSMGRECCLRLSRRLWGGMKNELPKESLRGRLCFSVLGTVLPKWFKGAPITASMFAKFERNLSKRYRNIWGSKSQWCFLSPKSSG